MKGTNNVLLQNSLRLAVRGDAAAPEKVILSFVGAINTQRYEHRRAELAFVEDGVRIAAGKGISATELDGWPALPELVDDVNELEIIGYACTDCATGRGLSTDHNGIEGLQWVPSEDVRLPLHPCSKHRTAERLELRTVEEQRAEQREFDDRVGHVTVGADRGGQ
jgi:sulfur relay (sulfurtransferase) complex TusBCD TusD component (DsrE family)